MNLRVTKRGYSSLDTIGRTMHIALRTHTERRLRQPGPSDLISKSVASPIDEVAPPASHRERQTKNDAISAHASQLDGLGHHLAGRLRLFEAVSGRERIGLVRQSS